MTTQRVIADTHDKLDLTLHGCQGGRFWVITRPLPVAVPWVFLLPFAIVAEG